MPVDRRVFEPAGGMIMTMEALDDARRRTERGLMKAQELGVAVNIAILDAGGHLVHFVRMDCALLGSIDVAVKKARTAALFRCESGALGRLSQPGGPIWGVEQTNGGLVSFGGGFPLTASDGRVIGAVGVAGGSVDEDEAVARACL